MKRPLIVLGTIIALYLAIAISIGRFTTTDEIAFKAAGREWAQSGRFAAPELSGFAHLQPPVEEIWFAHLPVYTFLFGVFVKLFGFGAWQSVAFDALIHAKLAVLTFLTARRVAPSASPWAAVVAAALVLPLGTFGRADELAVCFGMAALLVLPRSKTGAGALFGITAATNIIAAAFLGMVALIELRRVRDAFVLLFASAAAFLACLAPILIASPSAWRQFGSHASSQFATALSWGLTHSWIYGRQYLLSAAAAIVIGLAAVLLRRRDVLVRFVPFFAVLVVIGFVAAKSYYLWFVTPLLLAAACATAWELREHRAMQAAMLVAAMAYCGAIVVPLQQQVIAATLPSDQQLAPNVAAVRAHVPRGSVVLASELWSSLANDVQYRSLVHAATKIEDVDYVILTGNGSGSPGVPQTLDAAQEPALASRFEVVYDSLRRDTPRLFGVSLSRSGWGYGVRIYRSTSTSPLHSALRHP
ncbi:MAG TPA: hypothetical protein VGQ76_03220 [Thermoanaerobaculia bacterium]|nr:hypothetical protein [Thermoanaerobaculia bacterium]